MFKVINVNTTEVASFETKKEVADFISSQIETTNSLNTIQKKVSKAIKNEDVVYETFKIEEVEIVKDEFVASQLADNETEVVEDENKEIVYDNPADLQIEKLPLIDEVEQTEDIEETPVDENPVEETVEEIVEETPEVVEGAVEEIVEEIEEVKQDDTDALNEVFGEIKKDEDKKQEENEKKQSKRTVGKVLIAYENGEEFERFKSIKAAATYMKELLGLKGMPFTPIMKSAREGIDWNEYSFQFENPEDLHIPQSRKIKDKQSKDEQQQDVAENKIDDDIEEIVEVTEEIL
jgi:hypothetical protein